MRGEAMQKYQPVPNSSRMERRTERIMVKYGERRDSKPHRRCSRKRPGPTRVSRRNITTGKIAPGTGGSSDADHPMADLVNVIKADADCAPSFWEWGAVRYRAGAGCKAILRCYLAVGPGAEKAQR